MASLSSLTQLTLTSNFLQSALPDAPGASPASDALPCWLSNLTALRQLQLGTNAFSGTLPDCLSALTGLDFLGVARNALAGTIPDWLGSLTALRTIEMSYTPLNGTLPDSLGRLTNLMALYDAAGTRPHSPATDCLGACADTCSPISSRALYPQRWEA